MNESPRHRADDTETRTPTGLLLGLAVLLMLGTTGLIVALLILAFGSA